MKGDYYRYLAEVASDDAKKSEFDHFNLEMNQRCIIGLLFICMHKF